MITKGLIKLLRMASLMDTCMHDVLIYLTYSFWTAAVKGRKRKWRKDWMLTVTVGQKAKTLAAAVPAAAVAGVAVAGVAVDIKQISAD